MLKDKGEALSTLRRVTVVTVTLRTLAGNIYRFYHRITRGTVLRGSRGCYPSGGRPIYEDEPVLRYKNDNHESLARKATL